MVETKEVYSKAKASKENFERTAKRLKKLPLQLVKGKKMRSDEADTQLLQKVDAQLQNLQDMNGAIARSLNEVEVALLQLRHSRQLKKQARRDMPLADRRAEKAAAKQARKEKKVAAKARKDAEKSAKRQAWEAKKMAQKTERSKKKAAEKAARLAKKEAKQRAKKEHRLQKQKGAAAAPAANAPASGGPGSGLVGAQSSN
ncbi:MAG: hypothetical protein RIF32_20830 [Leptospirales bacterium]|jgi:acetyl/propionyl-CoA carboxylase alpha subunit